MPDGGQQYIHHNKKQNTYYWELLRVSEHELEEKAERIRVAGKRNELMNKYIDKKNCNNNPSRKSRSIYAEVVNDLIVKYKL